MKKTFLALALLFFAGCSPIATGYDYDVETDFTKLNTFSWYPIPEEIQVNDLVLKRIKNAVNRQLTAKGLRMAPDSSDFLIALHATRQTHSEAYMHGVNYGYGNTYRFGNIYGYRGTQWSGVYGYEEGKLILDFVDTRTSLMVWHGSATAVINPDLTPEKREERINKAIFKILEHFPPPVKSK